MQADRPTQREYGDDAAGARKHDEQASYRAPNVNASIRICQARRKRSDFGFINTRISFARAAEMCQNKKFLWLKKEIENQSFQQ